jgi:hypothetical protein
MSELELAMMKLKSERYKRELDESRLPTLEEISEALSNLDLSKLGSKLYVEERPGEIYQVTNPDYLKKKYNEE